MVGGIVLYVVTGAGRWWGGREWRYRDDPHKPRESSARRHRLIRLFERYEGDNG